jgi:hypothetical protein
VKVGSAALPGGLFPVNPLPKFPAGWWATFSLAARQVRRHHRITVIRATKHRRTDRPWTCVNVLIGAEFSVTSGQSAFFRLRPVGNRHLIQVIHPSAKAWSAKSPESGDGLSPARQ